MKAFEKEWVREIGICALIEELFPGYWDNEGYLHYTYEETSKAVMEWCEKNNAHYYGRGREEFFKWEGIEEAVALGKETVVFEDYS